MEIPDTCKYAIDVLKWVSELEVEEFKKTSLRLKLPKCWPFMVVWAHIVRCRVSTVPLDNQLANYNTHAHLERVRGSDT